MGAAVRRDPKHHTCVDRQAYHAMGAYGAGWATPLVLSWMGAPVWLWLTALISAMVVIPVLMLRLDGRERRMVAPERSAR